MHCLHNNRFRFQRLWATKLVMSLCVSLSLCVCSYWSGCQLLTYGVDCVLSVSFVHLIPASFVVFLCSNIYIYIYIVWIIDRGGGGSRTHFAVLLCIVGATAFLLSLLIVRLCIGCPAGMHSGYSAWNPVVFLAGTNVIHRWIHFTFEAPGRGREGGTLEAEMRKKE